MGAPSSWRYRAVAPQRRQTWPVAAPAGARLGLGRTGPGSGGLVGYFNLVMLAGIVWVFRAMRRGEYNETELERHLDNRGFFYRFFGPWMKVISKRWQMYPAGVIFGLASTPHRGPAPDDHRVAGL